MIHLNDLVKIKKDQGPDRGGRRGRLALRRGWIGIVTDVRSSAVGQTITVLWAERGLEETWTAEALEAIDARP